MTESDFPALYADANNTAIRVQDNFLLASKVVIFGSIATALIGTFATGKLSVVAQTVSSTLVLLAACYLLFGKPQKIWYSARALAESIKTITWRYVTRSEPFNVDSSLSDAQFVRSVSQLLSSNDEAAALRFSSAHTELITAAMIDLRNADLERRKQVYSELRVQDQLNWYRKKARWNDIRSKIWYSALIIFSLLALAASLFSLSVGFNNSVDWIFSLPVAILGWIQVKRYQELASSYSLTAHEIIVAKADFVNIQTNEQFANFVKETENAFSREHTQWYARKDIG